MGQCQAQQHSRRLRAPGKIRVEREGVRLQELVSRGWKPPPLFQPRLLPNGKGKNYLLWNHQLINNLDPQGAVTWSLFAGGPATITLACN